MIFTICIGWFVNMMQNNADYGLGPFHGYGKSAKSIFSKFVDIHKAIQNILATERMLLC
jgi:hypothetical protein